MPSCHDPYRKDDEYPLSNAEIRALRKLIQVPPCEEITPEVNVLLRMYATGIPQDKGNLSRRTIQFDKQGAYSFVETLEYWGWKLTKC